MVCIAAGNLYRIGEIMFDFIAQAAEPVITGLDVVKTVDAFYQNAWLMLIGLFAVIGIVMPFIIQRIQLSYFDKTEKRLKDEIEQIKNETQESIKEEVETLTSTFVEIQKNIEKKIDEETRLNHAEFYSQMALSFEYDLKNRLSSFNFYIIAAKDYAILKKYKSLTQGFNQAIRVSEGELYILSETSTPETKELAKQNQTMVLGQLDELSKILEEQGVKDRYSEQLTKIYENCENLLIVDDKPEPPEEPKQA